MTGEMLLQVLMSLGVGGLIGLEREFRTGNGLRTMMLICLGATLFALYGEKYGLAGNDPSRITSGVVTGVGFLGAAMILRHRAGIFGFTTAAALWLVAALGVGIGVKEYEVVAVSAGLVLFVLWGVPLARQFGGAYQTLAYEAVGADDKIRQTELNELMESHDLRVIRTTLSKEPGSIRYTWQASGSRDNHRTVMEALIADDRVMEFTVLQFDELS